MNARSEPTNLVGVALSSVRIGPPLRLRYAFSSGISGIFSTCSAVAVFLRKMDISRVHHFYNHLSHVHSKRFWGLRATALRRGETAEKPWKNA